MGKIASTEPSYVDGYYYPKVITWLVDDDKSIEIYLHMVMNNITRESLIDMNITGVYDYQIALIRSSYYNRNQAHDTVNMEYKRPFGNSYVEGDIIDAILKDDHYEI